MSQPDVIRFLLYHPLTLRGKSAVLLIPLKKRTPGAVAVGGPLVSPSAGACFSIGGRDKILYNAAHLLRMEKADEPGYISCLAGERNTFIEI